MTAANNDLLPDSAGGARSAGASRTVYAIGDIHGRFDLLQGALRAIAAHSRSRRSRLVFLGDYVDRGPQSREVVTVMMALQRDPGVTCLKGNHENLMVQALTSGRTSDMSQWIAAGGDQTLRSYGVSQLEQAREAIPVEHVRWMAGLPLTSGDGRRIYVHAGLMPSVSLEKQRPEWCLGIRDRFLRAAPDQFDAHIVHGHTPAWAGKSNRAEPELLAHRTNLDCGAYDTGVLAVGVFDEAVGGGPVELLVTYARSDSSVVTMPVAVPAASNVEQARPRAIGWLRFWPRPSASARGHR